jgi:hypothetical protein
VETNKYNPIDVQDVRLLRSMTQLRRIGRHAQFNALFHTGEDDKVPAHVLWQYLDEHRVEDLCSLSGLRIRK